MIKKPYNYIIFFGVYFLIIVSVFLFVHKIGYGTWFRKERPIVYSIVSEEKAREFETITHFNAKKREEQMIKYNDDYYLVIKMGEFSNGGHNIIIDNVEIKKNKAYIDVTEEHPGVSCTTTEAFTYPYVIVRFSRKPRYKVKRVKRTYECNYNLKK